MSTTHDTVILSKKCQMIFDAIIREKLEGNPVAIPARRPNNNQWFVALYVSLISPRPNYPKSIKLDDGSYVDVEIFSIEDPSAVHDMSQPTPEEKERVNDILQKTIDHLFAKYRNIYAIVHEGNSVVLEVRHIGILPVDDEPLPKEINGIPVIVREAKYDKRLHQQAPFSFLDYTKK